MSAALRLRPATADDMMLYFCWVNDPVVRAGAFHTEPIDLATHRAWFARALADARVQMQVLLADDIPVGQVRLTFTDAAVSEAWAEQCPEEPVERTALIAYSVASEYRGRGYGTAMLSLAEATVPPGTLLFGQVKRENRASRRVFLSLGYTESFSKRQDCWEYGKRIV